MRSGPDTLRTAALRANITLLAMVLLGVTLAACGDNAAVTPVDGGGDAEAADAAPPDSRWPCRADLPFPYAHDTPWVGIHGNRQNNNTVACDGPPLADLGWTALAGLAIFQPISVGPGGKVVYAIAARTEGCQLYAIDTSSGAPLWCQGDFSLGVSAGSPGVDEDGNIYVTDGYTEAAAVVSLTSAGVVRWRTPIEELDGGSSAPYRAPAGLHFTPAGLVATVSVDGVVVLLDRATGAIRSTFDIPAATGYVAGRARQFPVENLPAHIRDRIAQVVGPLTDEDYRILFGGSNGTSGAFSDNTIGVSRNHQLFVVGGGPDEDTGALVALDLGGDDAQPTLSLRWSALIVAGSATSPAISADGTRVALGDGADGLVYVRADRCNDNTDADPRVEVCAPAWIHHVKGRPIFGSVTVDEQGVVYACDTSLEPADADLFALADGEAGPRVLWQVSFAAAGGPNRQWTSNATLFDDMIVGTLTELTDAISIDGIPMPLVRAASHELVAVDRATGALLWRRPVADDSMNSIAVGPDGTIYVPLMGMIDLMALPGASVTFHGGVAQYVPRY
jgi:outer membrane protein assembly factor BamB